MLRAKEQRQLARRTRTLRLLAPVVLVCFLQGVAGCGTPQSPGAASTASGTSSNLADPPAASSAPATSPTPSTASTAPTRLTVEIRDSPDAPPVTSTLVCNGASPGAGSTVVDAAGACAVLEQNGMAIFAPQTVGDQKCTMQMATARVATVSGTFHGNSVTANFSQTDGCKIATWNSLAPLLGGRAGER